MLKYKILFFVLLLVVLYVLYNKYTEQFTPYVMRKDDTFDCKMNDCKCNNCKWFDYKRKPVEPQSIENMYMKNKRNILMTDNNNIIWEDDEEPAKYYGEKFMKVDCPNRDYFGKEDRCWKKDN